jgi:hypothetical protein
LAFVASRTLAWVATAFPRATTACPLAIAASQAGHNLALVAAICPLAVATFPWVTVASVGIPELQHPSTVDTALVVIERADLSRFGLHQDAE